MGNRVRSLVWLLSSFAMACTETSSSPDASLDAGSPDAEFPDASGLLPDATAATDGGQPDATMDASIPDAALPSRGMCNGADGPRIVQSAGVGQLLISEVMPNPAAANDAAGEWFELSVFSDLDLNGLQFGTTGSSMVATLNSPTCLRVMAGTFVLFARSGTASNNGGLPTVDHLFDFPLLNSNQELFIAVNSTALDSFAWASSVSGFSIQADPGNHSVHCNGSATYGDGDHGSPAAANSTCF